MTNIEELDFVLDFLHKNQKVSHAVAMTLHRFSKEGIQLNTPIKVLLKKLNQDGYCDISQSKTKMPFDLYRISFNGIQF